MTVTHRSSFSHSRFAALALAIAGLAGLLTWGTRQADAQLGGSPSAAQLRQAALAGNTVTTAGTTEQIFVQRVIEDYNATATPAPPVPAGRRPAPMMSP